MPYESIPRWRQNPDNLQISSSWFLPTFDGGLTRRKCDLSKRANDQTQLKYSIFFPKGGAQGSSRAKSTFCRPPSVPNSSRISTTWPTRENLMSYKVLSTSLSSALSNVALSTDTASDR